MLTSNTPQFVKQHHSSVSRTRGKDCDIRSINDDSVSSNSKTLKKHNNLQLKQNIARVLSSKSLIKGSSGPQLAEQQSRKAGKNIKAN